MSPDTTTAPRTRGERRSATVLGRALSIAVGVAIVVMSGISVAASPAQERAVALVRSFVSGDVEPYRQSADPKLLKALPAAQLAAVFEDLSRQGGAFVRLGDVSSQTRDGFTMVEIPLQYERATQVARIVLDGQGRLAGLQLRPSSSAVAFRSAPYVDPSRFSEQAETPRQADRAFKGLCERAIAELQGHIADILRRDPNALESTPELALLIQAFGLPNLDEKPYLRQKSHH